MSSKIIFDIEADGLLRESKMKVWDEELKEVGKKHNINI